jgi:ApbE superfamily uncharacterized protein (UPF0280 family)
MNNRSLFRSIFQYKETNCTIISNNREAIRTAVSSIKYHRAELEEYIKNNEIFLCSLRPLPISNGPRIVRLMADATKKANVGPMAAVAGVLADIAVEEMVLDGSEVAVVENGGEVSAVSNTSIDVALAAGDSQLSRTFGFRLMDSPIGAATSSGLFTHALSFGEAEAATVFASSAGLADAAATAVENQVKGEDCQAAINRGVGKALSIQGVEGVLIIYGGKVGIGGKTPRIIKVNRSGRPELLRYRICMENQTVEVVANEPR